MIIDLKAKYPLEYYINIAGHDRKDDKWVHEKQVKISEGEYISQNIKANEL